MAPVGHDPGESVDTIPLPPAHAPPVGTVAAIPRDVSAEYGEHLADAVAHCMECHSTPGPQGPMVDTHSGGAGGLEVHGPWGGSVAPNITSGPQGVGRWSDAELAAMILGLQSVMPLPSGVAEA